LGMQLIRIVTNKKRVARPYGSRKDARYCAWLINWFSFRMKLIGSTGRRLGRKVG
jgi:hypothetical protein